MVGAGTFALSTALAIARRQPSTRVTVIDRQVPPVVEDGTSVDTTRCIRSVYADPEYGRLAVQVQRKIEEDPELKPYSFKQGMSFITSCEPGSLLEVWKKGLDNPESQGRAGSLVHMWKPEKVSSSIHGENAQLTPESDLGRERSWTYGYCNTEDAFIDAKLSVRVYYEPCLRHPSIIFKCGIPVERLSIRDGRATGASLQGGETLSADLTVIAAGGWSPKLVGLEGLMYSTCLEVAWVKLTAEEVEGHVQYD